jgi:drug/metabolite transporter (DMT)-like permease
MGIIYSLLAVLGESLSVILDRLNFKKTRISAQQLMPLMFFFMSVMICLFIFVTRQPFPEFTTLSIALIALIILVSFGGNVFDFLSLKVDDISLREPLADFEPIVGGLVGYILFAQERKPSFLVAFILGAVIVYWGTHRRKLRRLQSKGMLFMLFAVCLYGLLPSIYKVTLEYIDPAYLTLIRVVAILLLSIVFFPKKLLHRLSSKKVSYAAASGIVCAIAAVAS